MKKITGEKKGEMYIPVPAIGSVSPPLCWLYETHFDVVCCVCIRHLSRVQQSRESFSLAIGQSENITYRRLF